MVVPLGYPDRVPVIVEKKKECKDIPDLDKNKFLVPKDIVFSQFIYILRKKIKLSPDKGIFVFTNNKLVPGSSNMNDIYEQEKDPNDNMLYVTYSGESVFG